MTATPDVVVPAQTGKVWRSDRTVAIPPADILSFTFANVGSYDQNKPIFIDASDPSNYVSAANAQVTVNQLINGLRAHGLREGECVSLHSYNNIWYPLLWLAVIGAGGCVSGTNPAYTSTELIHQFSITNTKYIFAQTECLKAIEEAAAQCQIPRSCIFLLNSTADDAVTGYKSWRCLLKKGNAGWMSNCCNRRQYKDSVNRVAVYASTSGTTGLPKAAALPHSYVVAQCIMLQDQLKDVSYQPSQLVCLPVFHAFAAQVALVLPLRLGITTYFMPRFKLPAFVNFVKAFEITDIAVVPPIITALIRHLPSDPEALRSLRYIVCAGAPMTAAVQAKLYDWLSPETCVGQCWGATELGWITLFNQKSRDTSGSVGRLLANVELKIVDDSGNLVTQDGQPGEAYIRSPSIFLRYAGNLDASKQAIDTDGFYRTGDRVYIDSGKVYVDGRVKDIMKVNGWQVSPAEIENVLVQHPQIADAAVLGIATTNADGLQESLPRAYIVRTPETKASRSLVPFYPTPPDSPDLGPLEELTEEDVKDFVAARLVSYKRLSGGVVFVDHIPRNGTGKILHRLLKE